MKTTVELSDHLAAEARELARREGTTLRELIEAGLRRVLRERGRPGPFRLRDAGFQGQGLQPGFQDADWRRIREAAYQRLGE